MIVIKDIAYARVAAPDLDLMESFFKDFGMQCAARDDKTLYLRGHDSDPVVHVVEKGAARQIGLALKAQSHADLERLAAELGKRIEKRTEPGGGAVVKLTDPDGNLVEVIHGFEPSAPVALRDPIRFNALRAQTRRNDTVRVECQPAHVMRLGHVAIHAVDLQAMFAFYRDHLGFKLSDSFYVEDPSNMLAAFLHCGLGDQFTDHHTIALIGDKRSGFDHLGFEVLDLDDLMMGNRYLKSRSGWEHSWGVGRHKNGSQIFDYWRDPTGLKVEHWTDGDRINDAYQSSNTAFSLDNPAEVLSQWGPPFDADFLR